MRSSNRTYLASVDHIRAFAAILIVLYHGTQLLTAQIGHNRAYAGDPDWLYSRNPMATVIFEGHTAVALFMVLSGFIFTVGTLGHEVSFPKFMTNRLLRIYPLFLLLVLIGVAANPGTVSAGGLLQLIGGLGNLPGSMSLGPVSGMFWAIAVEMQFYLLFPLLNRLLTRFGMPTFARMLAAVVVVRALVWAVSQSHDVYHMLYLNLAGRIDQFLLGMVAAWLFVRHGKRFRGWWKVAVSVTLIVTALWAFNQVHGFASTSAWRLAWIDVEGAGWALAILTYVATCRATNIAALATAKIGEFSYSIYLLHFVVLSVIIDHRWFLQVSGLSATANALLTTGAVLLPLVLAISVVTYYGIEQPFLRLRVKYLLSAPPEKAVIRDSAPAQAVALEPQAEAEIAHRPNRREAPASMG
ncbi:MAG: acyltransferase family protein [Labedaea sp.]